MCGNLIREVLPPDHQMESFYTVPYPCVKASNSTNEILLIHSTPVVWSVFGCTMIGAFVGILNVLKLIILT